MRLSSRAFLGPPGPSGRGLLLRREHHLDLTDDRSRHLAQQNQDVAGVAGVVLEHAGEVGEVFILGDVVDRGWTNSVNFPVTTNAISNLLRSSDSRSGR